MKLAMPKVLDQGAKRPSLDTSRTLGVLMTSGRHSERPKVQGKEEHRVIPDMDRRVSFGEVR